MEKFTPYEKLSKRRKREADKARRGSWGAMSPVTRRPENPKAYNRKKAGKWRGAADSGLLPVITIQSKKPAQLASSMPAQRSNPVKSATRWIASLRSQ